MAAASSDAQQEAAHRVYRIDPPKLSVSGEGRAGNSRAVEEFATLRRHLA
jgi:hypothetical protein